MKKIFTICAAILMTASVFAQTPEKMSYQAVVRNGSNALVTNQSVGMRISLLQGSASGTAVYVETQIPTSNANGLVSIEIGSGTVVSGTFTAIDWAAGPYFIKTETDPAGGTNYTITGTSQMLSVPYALYAKTAGSVSILTTINCIATPTAIVDVTNSTTGKTWMDRNIGATRAATSSADVQSYGDLYQWGRRSDGHQCRSSLRTGDLSGYDQPTHGSFIVNGGSFPNDWRNVSTSLQLWEPNINSPCPSGYRVPSESELSAERTSWSSNNGAGAFASPLKLPMAGSRDANSGGIIFEGGGGWYWSSTRNTNGHAFYLSFNTTAASTSSQARAFGWSVRCIKN